MDGFKERLNSSIQLRLSLWLSVAILAMAVLAGGFSFVAAYGDANELQDGTLTQVGALVGKQSEYAVGHKGMLELDPELRLIVQSLTGAAPANPAALALPSNIVDGLQTVHISPLSYRVFVQTLSDGGRIAVSQETTVRNEIARDSALRTVLPMLIMVPILLLLVAKLVSQLLRPVARLAGDIDARSEQALHPFRQEGVPTEIRPFVNALNRLLERVAQSMETQRRFVADASHELRSPMAALSLQAEMLGSVAMPEEATKRLEKLRQGIDRGRNLLDQLLSLARAQSVKGAAPSPVSVQHVFRRVLEDLMPLAEAKQIDLGLEDAADAQVLATEVDLIAIVKNLLDNAIRYTPAGGRIDVSVVESPGHALLQVEDNGPGIPESERGRVVDPFYRVLGSQQTGSGLGLSIVNTVTRRLGGILELGPATAFPSGLCARVTLPK